MIDWLQKWYISQCNGSWEEFYGIKIVTLDNPGWHVKIDLMETDAENKPFVEVKRDRSDTDWIYCRIQDATFDGCGDISKLSEILTIFKNFIQE